MKVIVTGATGRIGREAVRQCLDNEAIHKVVILTRTGVPGDIESHPKRLQGAKACIWAISPRPNQGKLLHRTIQVHLPLLAARIFAERLAPKTPDGCKFRFVYCSRKHTEGSRTKTLLFGLADTPSSRLARELDKGMAQIVDAHRRTLEVYTLRPGPWVSCEGGDGADGSFTRPMMSRKVVQGCVDARRVGRAMGVVASDGWKGRVLEKEAILKLSNEGFSS
ncbi:hypothetical protein E4U55_001539 [Claviceps digitariae]|nr:hypothetical protein E4U55_001539 [Claviceps digitariae]